MAKIIIIDDDIDLCSSIEEWLTFEHHTVELVHEGQDGAHRLKISNYDMIILDWQIPDKSGVEICREFRARGGSTPVLMLTGKKEIHDKIEGFQSGADDYLTKPFHMQELAVRVNALLRRGLVTPVNIVTRSYLSLDPTTRKVTKNGQEVYLLPKEFALLEYLMRRPNQVLSLEVLLQSVWESTSEASPDVVRTTVKRLRDKIDIPGSPSLIATKYGVGYAFEDNTP